MPIQERLDLYKKLLRYGFPYGNFTVRYKQSQGAKPCPLHIEIKINDSTPVNSVIRMLRNNTRGISIGRLGNQLYSTLEGEHCICDPEAGEWKDIKSSEFIEVGYAIN